jgi:predicted outer membrane repeat protein
LTDGNPVISIVGAGEGATIIDGNLTDRIVLVFAHRTVKISGVSLINGNLSALSGGAIYNLGTLYLSDVTVFNCKAQSGGGLYNAPGGSYASLLRVTLQQNFAATGGAITNLGTLYLDHGHVTANTSTSDLAGGIYSEGLLQISFSTLNDNGTPTSGGAIYAASGTLYLDDSTLDGNHASGGGGGALYVDNATNAYLRRDTLSRNTAVNGGAIFNANSQLFMSNVTVSQNQATNDGGGIYSVGLTNIYNLTIAYNEADADADGTGDGAGVFNAAGFTFNAGNSLLVGNYLAGTQPYYDCFGLLGVYGNDKFSGTSGCAVAPASTGTAAYIGSLDELGILKDNGGPTQTIAIVLPSNDLIGHGLSCKDWTGQPVVTDQRGHPRPPAATGRCDIGAFEYNELFANGFE